MNDDIVAAGLAFLRPKSAAPERLDSECLKNSGRDDSAGNSLWVISARKVERGVVKGANVLEAAHARLIIDEFRWRDGNAVEVLRFKMLEKQNELMRRAVRQRTNEQRVDQA